MYKETLTLHEKQFEGLSKLAGVGKKANEKYDKFILPELEAEDLINPGLDN